MHGLGFGANNNYIFNWCINNLGLTEDDYFLVLNPDVDIDSESILSVAKSASIFETELSTINLYKDDTYSALDNCIRSFPSLIDFITSYAGLGNKTVLDKKLIDSPRFVDWAAGSFLLFKASLYRDLGGFDSGYFMYCEDIDICWRAQREFNQRLMFYPNVRAIHYAKHANRSFFTMHFIWHLKSMCRYLFMYYGFRRPFTKK